MTELDVTEKLCRNMDLEMGSFHGNSAAPNRRSRHFHISSFHGSFSLLAKVGRNPETGVSESVLAGATYALAGPAWVKLKSKTKVKFLKFGNRCRFAFQDTSLSASATYV
jgi:hypothetical protein